MSHVTVHRNRLNKMEVVLTYDVSNSLVTSEIRKGISQESALLATWDVSYLTDGTDGRLVLELDDSDGSITSDISEVAGYMDIKRVVGEQAIPVFEDPVLVVFHEVVTE